MNRLIFLLVFLLSQASVISQTIEVSSFVDKNKVSTNDIITFTITTNSNCQIYTPNFDKLTVVQGPFQSSSSKIVNYNGQRSIEQEIKFTYRLRAPKAGSYKINAVKLVCGGKEYETKSIQITASEGTSTSTGQPNNIPNNNSDFFIRMYSNKSTVFQGESFTISIKIYSKSQPQNIESLELGDSKGLLRKDLNPKKSTFNSEIEVVNGMRYYTTTIRTELCYAHISGKIEVKPAHISAIFRKGIFRQFRKEANSNSLSITVTPLPAGAPKNFNGLVGSVSLTHSVSKTVLKPGEAIDLQLIISGEGNLNTFDDPEFSFPNDFEQFDPEVKNKLSYSRSGTSGKIIYNYVLIPTFYGNYKIPAYSFSYFDLASNTYKSLSTGDIAIEVLKTANSQAGNTGLNQTKKIVKVEEKDIHHLFSNSGPGFMTDDFIITKFWYYALLLIPVIAMWILLWKRKKNQSGAYLESSAIKTSYNSSMQNLILAKKLANEQQEQESIQEVSVALKTFLKQKNNLSNINLNGPYLLNLYRTKSWPEADINRLETVWNSLEMYQYAPITAEKLDDLILETEKLIEQINTEK